MEAEKGGVMDALRDYIDLRFAVSDLVGSREISDVMKRLTLMAETKLNSRLRTQWQVTDFTPVWTGNEAPLPADFLELVCSDNRLSAINGVLTRAPYRTWPDGIEYYAALPTLTTSLTTTNWLLERFSQTYLYAVAEKAAIHLTNAELAMAMGQALEAELKQVRVADDRARWGNKSVQVRGLTP